ncbi:MAG: exodeoxyribonuclease III [Polyangia bacterium]
MKLASWNVNSIRARIDRVIPWLEATRPDVLCMQELKAEEKDFPREAFERIGYQVAAACQKTYNGVAICSLQPATDVMCGLGDGDDDPQARLVAATVAGVRVLSAYVPNGQSVGSDKYAYKLRWLERLRGYLDARCDPKAPLVLCGDFNVAPEERDVYDPVSWANETLFHIEARQALERVRAFGLTDTFRLHHEEAGVYSWWDYRMLSFPKNRGLRIDHVFVTEPLARRCASAWIDREARKGKLPSDHAPVLASFE